MLKKLLLNMYDLDEILLYNFNDLEISNHIIELEENNYKRLNICTLKVLQKVLTSILLQYNSFYKENFEIALENNDETLIFTRIYNHVNKYINELSKNKYDKQPLYINLYDCSNNQLLYLDNLGGSVNELEEKVIKNIETKFLFFVLNDFSVKNSTKHDILLNSLFINPYLSESMDDHKKTIHEYLTKEDEEYNELDDMMKIIHDKYIIDYSFEVLKDIFYNLLTNTDLNQTELRIYELYIRTVFSNLDDDLLEQLNYNFNELNVNIINKDGEKVIRNAFQSINNDKNIIKQIKNIR